MTTQTKVNSIVKKILTLFKGAHSQKEYEKYIVYIGKLDELIPNVKNREKYIRLESPEPSNEFVVKLTEIIYSIFNKNNFSDICIEITPKIIKEALQRHLEKIGPLLEKNTIIIFNQGWDSPAGQQYLKNDGYMLWELFYEISKVLGFYIAPFKYGNETYEEYVERASILELIN